MAAPAKNCTFAVIATGESVGTLAEFKEALKRVPASSIEHHFTKKRPEYSNDFANWAHTCLHDDILAERLGILDPQSFSDIESLRKEIIAIVEKRLSETPCIKAEKFHFLRSQTVIFDPHLSLPIASELIPYQKLLGPIVTDQLMQLGKVLKKIKVVHVNSTKEGGGVAEILHKMVPLTHALGIDTRWEVIDGEGDFFECTKQFHNLMQGHGSGRPSSALLQNYEATAAKNAQKLKLVLEDADIVIIHDPQPLPLITHFPKRKGKWIWRCHIDCSYPSIDTWNYLLQFIKLYDASIFSLDAFTRPLPHPIFIIPPSIDPFTDKNIELEEKEILEVQKQFNIDPKRPKILQVSRFDRFKDPLGVIEAYHLVKKFHPDMQLILAGGGASDDPEGEAVLKEVISAANNDPDIHILFLPSDSHRIINALQRAADIVLQKSLKEGFGLTITEALWKMKPVIGGNTGGIRLQVIDHQTGFLVNTPEGAALRIRYLLQNPEKRKEFGASGKRLVMEKFLITRHLREYLTVMATLLSPRGDQLDLR